MPPLAHDERTFSNATWLWASPAFRELFFFLNHKTHFTSCCAMLRYFNSSLSHEHSHFNKIYKQNYASHTQQQQKSTLQIFNCQLLPRDDEKKFFFCY